MDRPLVGRLLEHPDDLVALLLGAPGRREAMTSRMTSAGLAASWTSVWARIAISSPNSGGDLVGVAGAADVAQQRHPVGGLAHVVVEARRLADPRREQARPQLRLERLAEGVVLRERQRGDELTQAKRCVEIGSPPDVRCRDGERSIVSHDASLPSLQRGSTLKRREEIMASIANAGDDPIKVGVIADQTGPLSFIGLANANVARMVIGDINAKGGLLGRQLELHLEDSATDDAVAAAKAAKLVEEDQVDVVFGGIYSSTRQAIKGPAVVEGKTLYIYPEQYEGQESDPLIFCTGPVPAQQVDPFIPWLMRETGAKTFYLPVGRLHLAARAERARPGGRHGERRHDRRRGVLPARPHGLPRDRRADHRERRRRRVQHDRAARA